MSCIRVCLCFLTASLRRAHYGRKARVNDHPRGPRRRSGLPAAPQDLAGLPARSGGRGSGGIIWRFAQSMRRNYLRHDVEHYRCDGIHERLPGLLTRRDEARDRVIRLRCSSHQIPALSVLPGHDDARCLANGGVLSQSVVLNPARDSGANGEPNRWSPSPGHHPRGPVRRVRHPVPLPARSRPGHHLGHHHRHHPRHHRRPDHRPSHRHGHRSQHPGTRPVCRLESCHYSGRPQVCKRPICPAAVMP
jgi:hypothetical protein